MWASVDTDNNVTKVYTRPTAITYGDVNYPQNVMSSWTNDELATIAVYPAIKTQPTTKTLVTTSIPTKHSPITTALQ
jgi:hypothetical protein